MSSMNVTYTQQIFDTRLFDLAKEAGDVYSKALIFFKRVIRKKSIFLSNNSIQRYIESFVDRKYLHSQSFQASYQKLFDNLRSFYKANEEYKLNPSKFTNKPRMPKKRKFFQPIQFKKSAIKFNNGFLELSIAKIKDIEPEKDLKTRLKEKHKPETIEKPKKVKIIKKDKTKPEKKIKENAIRVKWNTNITVPKFVTIDWNKNKRYWQLNCVIDKNVEEVDLDKKAVMSVDLGVKRIATTYDGKKAITFSGKKTKALVIGRNKINAKTQEKLSKLKKGSRKYKKIKKANGKVNLKTDNKMKDVLHKTSRTLVNECIQNNIGKIVIGECSGIHTGTDCGKKNNQQIQQNPEQKLKKYIEYKMKSIGGKVATIPENYTSQTCPSCCERYKPTSRIYKCPSCKYIDDRDVVGAKNIYKVSFGIAITARMNVIGSLTEPRGWKHRANHNCKVI